MDGSMSPMSMEQHEMMERQMMMQQQQQQQAMMQQHDEVAPLPPCPRGLCTSCSSCGFCVVAVQPDGRRHG